MYQVSKCSNCKEITITQPIGDGCHKCLKGTMQVINKPFTPEESKILAAQMTYLNKRLSEYKLK